MTEAGAPTGEVKSLQWWRDALFCARGAAEVIDIWWQRPTSATGGWKKDIYGQRADVLGLSRSSGQQEPTLVRGLGTMWSRFVCPRNPPPTPPATGNPIPRIIAHGARAASAIVAWDTPTLGQPNNGYRYRYRNEDQEDAAPTWATPGTRAASDNDVMLSSLAPDKRYFFQLRGDWTDTDNNRWGPVLAFQTPPNDDLIEVRPPSSLTVQPMETEVTLRWQAGDDHLGDFSERKNPVIQQAFARRMSVTQVNSVNGLPTSGDRMSQGSGDRLSVTVPGTAREATVRGLEGGGGIGYGVGVLSLDATGAFYWSDIQYVTTLTPFECGTWADSAQYEVGSPITYVFPFREADWFMAENGLYAFDIHSNFVNQLSDLQLQPNEGNRWITPFHDGVLASTAYGLYRLLPAASQTTTGIEECQLDRLPWGPPRCAVTIGRYVYEARQSAQNFRTVIIQYRKAEEGDTSFRAPLTPIAIVDVSPQTLERGQVNAMALAGGRCWYGMGDTLRSFPVWPVARPPISHHPGAAFSQNQPGSVADGEAYLSFSPTFFGAPETQKYLRRVTVNVRGKGWMEFRANHEGAEADVVPDWTGPTTRANQFTAGTEPDFDSAHDDIYEFDMRAGANGAPYPPDEQVTLEMRVRGYDAPPAGTYPQGDQRATEREFVLTGVTAHYESFPTIMRAWTLAIETDPNLTEQQDARAPEKIADDIVESLTRGPVKFVPPGAPTNEESDVTVSRYDEQVDWVFVGDSSSTITLLVREIDPKGRSD